MDEAAAAALCLRAARSGANLCTLRPSELAHLAELAAQGDPDLVTWRAATARLETFSGDLMGPDDLDPTPTGFVDAQQQSSATLELVAAANAVTGDSLNSALKAWEAALLSKLGPPQYPTMDLEGVEAGRCQVAVAGLMLAGIGNAGAPCSDRAAETLTALLPRYRALLAINALLRLVNAFNEAGRTSRLDCCGTGFDMAIVRTLQQTRYREDKCWVEASQSALGWMDTEALKSLGLWPTLPLDLRVRVEDLLRRELDAEGRQRIILGLVKTHAGRTACEGNEKPFRAARDFARVVDRIGGPGPAGPVSRLFSPKQARLFSAAGAKLTLECREKHWVGRVIERRLGARSAFGHLVAAVTLETSNGLTVEVELFGAPQCLGLLELEPREGCLHRIEVEVSLGIRRYPLVLERPGEARRELTANDVLVIREPPGCLTGVLVGLELGHEPSSEGWLMLRLADGSIRRIGLARVSIP